jgi:serine/threonine protein kinase
LTLSNWYDKDRYACRQAQGKRKRSGTLNEPEIQINPAVSVAEVQLPDGFELLGILGAGAHSNVYKATFRLMERTVALKVIKSDGSDDMQKQIARMQREAKALAKLSHENIVQIYQVGLTPDGHPFLACEYLEGVTLKDWLSSHKTLSRQEVIDIFPQILDAMQFAHENGLIHRDIKPSNIMLLQEKGSRCFRAKLLDFGIARDLELPGSAGITATSALSGSPAYMSPEQCRAEKLDLRSDLYSLACVLYECIFGEPPFSGESAFAVLYKHVHENLEAESLQKKAGAFGLAALLKKALAKDANTRPQSAAAFKAELIESLAKSSSGQSLVLKAAVTVLLAVLLCWVACRTAPEHKSIPEKDDAVPQTGSNKSKASVEHRLTGMYRSYNDGPEGDTKEKLDELEELLPLTSGKKALRFAALYLKSGLLSEAQSRRKALEEALELCKNAEGGECFEAGYCYYGLASLEKECLRYNEERNLLRKAVSFIGLSQEGSVAKHLEIPEPIEHILNAGFQGTLLISLGRNSEHLNDYNAALDYYLTAEKLTRRSEPSAAASLILKQAGVLKQLGQTQRADQLAKELLFSVVRQSHGNPSVDVRQDIAFLNIARWYYHQREIAACRETLETGLATVRKDMPKVSLQKLHLAKIAELKAALSELNAAQKVASWDAQPEPED